MPSRHDQLNAAWDQLARAGRNGPLDERMCRLLELAVAIGARDREAVRMAHEKLTESLVMPQEIDQLLALAAATIGKPATLTAYGWIGLIDPDTPSGHGTPTTSSSGGRAPKPSDA
jgi:alkylhydroperoxidase/carboxymuconolactone decarboxylase family protein YurZ